MKKQIHITTFRKGQSSGLVIPIGTFELEVENRQMPMTGRVGCFSQEIMKGRVFNAWVVTLAEREFVVDEDRVDGPDGPSVTVPWEVAEKVKKQICPHCGKLILP